MSLFSQTRLAALLWGTQFSQSRLAGLLWGSQGIGRVKGAVGLDVSMFSLFNMALLSVAVHYQTVNSVLLWGLRVERKINGRGREMQKE